MAEFITLESRHAGQIADRVFHAGQQADFVFGRGTAMFSKIPAEIYGRTECRIVDDAAARWMEFGFRMDHLLGGNGAAGYTDAANYFRLEIEQSTDLVNWNAGKFVPAPLPVVANGDGTWTYWSRATNPLDSVVKTGLLVASNPTGDIRSNGFTSLVLAGVAQALPNFPYDMAVAGTAAQLQSDLTALGWAGAIVAGTTATNWSISISGVVYASYSAQSYVGFPSYLIADSFGDLTINRDRSQFDGSFVDASGTLIFPAAFARLKITKGSRYL